MAKNKTLETEKSVSEFLDEFVANETKREESKILIDLMSKVSGYEAKMWGPSIIGFGSYHYVYDSGREGDAPIIAFSPRKAAFSLYVFRGNKEDSIWLSKLGKYKMEKGCIYVKKVADIDLNILSEILKDTIKLTLEQYPTQTDIL
ncbi:DUF1801 domain-containing protein [Flectobacillus longus]|uniref:DUF1801 domain-containing protein n=1 Tax=Flectobacillus longus TaxID=2984207 RepID=UPI0024B85F9D|nr:DUF1801 domain-containing protein [Flectobacillus longus]MDI9879612.1 DUF1801 domain-containing protein [Flectobacillus longus]